MLFCAPDKVKGHLVYFPHEIFHMMALVCILCSQRDFFFLNFPPNQSRLTFAKQHTFVGPFKDFAVVL